jgi:hypothetical protein
LVYKLFQRVASLVQRNQNIFLQVLSLSVTMKLSEA